MAGSRTIRRAAVTAALTGTVVLLAALTSQAAFHTSLVTRASNGDPADGSSDIDAAGGSISHDGKLVAFTSVADNLPQGDGVTRRCYVRNLKTGKTRLVSVASNGDPASDDTQDPKLSANGRYIAFFGSGLPHDDNQSQIWLHDLKTQRTRLASRTTGGDPGDDTSAYPTVSGSGRFVAFESSATNFPGSITGDSLAYVRDMKRGKLIVGSRTADGDPATGNPYSQALSSDGRMLTFESRDDGLPHGSDPFDHAYVRNLKTGKVELVDKATDGTVGDGAARDPSISADGRFAAFSTSANNIPGSETNGAQVFVRDLKRDKLTLVSQNDDGDPQEGDAGYGHPSADGRYVAFQSTGANLPQGDGVTHLIYLRDMRREKTTLISKAENGDPADGRSDYPSISLDSNWISFKSAADNLGGDTAVDNVFRAGPIG